MRALTSAVIFASLLMTGCTVVNTEPGTETVIMDKPMFFGQGGVRSETYKPGRNYTWWSSEGIPINMKNMKVEEVFDDLMTRDTFPVDFRTSLQLRITRPVEIVTTYGTDTWYTNNLQRQYQALVRDEAKKYSMTELLTGVDTASAMEQNVRKGLDAIIKANNLPFVVADLSIGRAMPNKNVLEQINLTAAQQQRSKTMVEQEKAEQQRKKAEQARAAADNAYRQEMQLSPDQFLQLESIKRYSEACTGAGSTCTFVMGGQAANMMLPVKK